MTLHLANESLRFCTIVERYVKNSAARQLAYFVQEEYDQTPLTREILFEYGFIADMWDCLHLKVGECELAWWEMDQIIAIDANKTSVKTKGDLCRLISLLTI